MADEKPTTMAVETGDADGEPSSHTSCGDDPAGQVAETFPGTGTDPQATPQAAPGK